MAQGSLQQMNRQAQGLFISGDWKRESHGPLYLQLQTHIEKAIETGRILHGDPLPSEREIAAMTGLSRVTVRRAVQELARRGLVVQKPGSGTFIAPEMQKVEQSLSTLTSFSEDMARRGNSVQSRWMEKGIFAPSPEETMVLGLASTDMVARVSRLRIADNVPMAIERATISTRFLPDPDLVTDSLYAQLDRLGNKPVRAIQRISAANLGRTDADLLEVGEGAAGLNIVRVSYLQSGKVVEFTRSVYRGDAYDFVAELKIGNNDDADKAQ